MIRSLLLLLAVVVSTLAASASASARQARYCERPNPNASLAASAGVSCATAKAIRKKLLSPACFTRTRCTALGFRCVAYWDGRFDRPFTYSHYAICTKNWLWVVWNGG